jgi:sigma-B regulation protein RsbU (phosphoserine phosphatase)
MTEKPGKILIVDDTRANIQILYEVFHREYETFFATNGADGIEIARRETPDIILLDIMMPEMDGYEVCTVLKADPLTAAIPVVFVTAMGEEEDETKGLDCGAIDYVTKPISPPIVRARVRNHLELKRGRDLLQRLSEELAAKNATLEREKALAHRLLQTILPEDLQIPGFCTAIFFKPSDQIGGDFFDGWSDGDHAHFLVGDISGHNISAALLMAVCKGLFMTIGRERNDPAEIIATANRTLSRILAESEMYLTMIYAVCDIRRRVLSVASAGHNPAYIYSSSSRIAIESSGPPIGWDPDDRWTVAEYPFVEGDKILLYTDGVIDTRNSAGEFCQGDIFSAVDATFTEKAMVEQVLKLAEDFCAGAFDDDLTLFAIGYQPAPLPHGAC